MGTKLGSYAAGASRVALTYVGVSAAWIVVTDWWLEVAFGNPRQYALFQTGKGLLFITLSGVLIFALVRREQGRLETTNDELERTLKHAKVMHRLLRHNLRNSCDVIHNNVELLESGRADAEASHARIRRQAASMSSIAEKSQHLRDVATKGRVDPVPQDLKAVVEESVTEARRSHPGATFSVEAAAPVRVLAHPRLAVAVEELLTNAVSHHDGAAPEVTVTTERAGEFAVVRIADDGPGLPDIERTVLEEGVEDALTHSQGIGLWVVRFIVTASGGSLTVPSSSNDGTVVSLRVPVADG